MNISAFVASPIRRASWAPFGKFGLSLQTSSSGLITFIASSFKAPSARAAVVAAISTAGMKNSFFIRDDALALSWLSLAPKAGRLAYTGNRVARRANLFDEIICKGDQHLGDIQAEA